MLREELQEELNAGRMRLLAAISGVTEEQFKRRPPATDGDAEPWSIAENLGHLLQVEQTWAGRIAMTVTTEKAEITPSPPSAQTEGAAAARRAPVPQLIHGLLAARRDVEKRLAAVREEDFRLSAWHPRLKEDLTLAWMFRKVIEHEAEHCLKIEGLRERLAIAPRSAERAR